MDLQYRQLHIGRAQAHTVGASPAITDADNARMPEDAEPSGYPCPFCGCRFVVVQSVKIPKPMDNQHFFIECQDCRATGPRSGCRMVAVRWWSEGWWIDTAVLIRKKQSSAANT